MKKPLYDICLSVLLSAGFITTCYKSDFVMLSHAYKMFLLEAVL